MEIGSEVLIIFGIIVIAVLIAMFVSSRYKVASANEALVRSGQRGKGEELKVVRGGGMMVIPLLHDLGRLKLTARQISVQLTDAVTSQGIKVALEGVATFKVGADETSIRNAAERFLETDEAEVDDIVKNVLEGSLRSIVGTLTVEDLNLDRQKFQQAVQSAAIGDLATSGLVIDSFTIQAIGGEALQYMELVGRQELARRERDARMAQATADQEARVREAESEQIKLNAERGVQLREADVKQETDTARAKAGQAGPLAEAQATQQVVKEQTKLAELAAERKAKELLTSTVRPAEAEAEAVVKRADGDRLAAIAAAQAEAEKIRLRGEAEADHHPGAGTSGGGRPGDARRRLQALQRCGHPGHHPARPAGRRGRCGRSHRQDRQPDGALHRRGLGDRAHRHHQPDPGRSRHQGPHRHRHPAGLQQRARQRQPHRHVSGACTPGPHGACDRG